METHATEPVSLFIKKTDIDQNVLQNGMSKRDDAATAYIIYQNNHLLQQYLDEVNKNKELVKEKEELEEFNDKLEQTRTCLLGYVKNEHAAGETHKKLAKLYRTALARQDKLMIMSNVLIIPYVLFALGALVTLLSMSIKRQPRYTSDFVPRYTSDFVWSSLILAINIAYIVFHACVIVRAVRTERRTYTSDPAVAELLEEIANTKKSNTYLHELLDNM